MESNKEKQNLAYKTKYGWTSIIPAVIILAVAIASACAASDWHWFVIIAVLAAAGFATFADGILYLTLPQVLVKYDDDGIYIYKSRKREVFIKYEDIMNILDYRKSVKLNSALSYTHGTLHIRTRDGAYDSYTVEDVTKVAQTVYKLKKEHGFPDLGTQKAYSPVDEYMKMYKPLAVIGMIVFIACIITMTVTFSVLFDKWGLIPILGILIGFGGTFAAGMIIKTIYGHILGCTAKKLVTAKGIVESCTLSTLTDDRIKGGTIHTYKIKIDVDGVKTTARKNSGRYSGLRSGESVSVIYNPKRPRKCVIITDN